MEKRCCCYFMPFFLRAGLIDQRWVFFLTLIKCFACTKERQRYVRISCSFSHKFYDNNSCVKMAEQLVENYSTKILSKRVIFSIPCNFSHVMQKRERENITWLMTHIHTYIYSPDTFALRGISCEKGELMRRKGKIFSDNRLNLNFLEGLRNKFAFLRLACRSREGGRQMRCAEILKCRVRS